MTVGLLEGWSCLKRAKLTMLSMTPDLKIFLANSSVSVHLLPKALCFNVKVSLVWPSKVGLTI